MASIDEILDVIAKRAEDGPGKCSERGDFRDSREDIPGLIAALRYLINEVAIDSETEKVACILKG